MTGPRLEGKTALIVGGTSGIGLASARRFLDEGAQVLVCGLAPVADEDSENVRSSDRFTERVCDVREESSVLSLFRETTDRFERLDIMLHVAGMSGRKFGDGPLDEATAEGWDRTIEANARSVFLSNREAVRVMRAQTVDPDGLRGTIVNLGSVLSESPSTHHFATIAYAASKGAVRSLTLAAASRYAAEGIRFNLIEPGLIETPMAARAAGDPQILSFLKTKQPISGRPGTADDVAEAAVYLASRASKFVTGAILRVDGGWSVSEGQY